jgi:hypothetical protein
MEHIKKSALNFKKKSIMGLLNKNLQVERKVFFFDLDDVTNIF